MRTPAGGRWTVSVAADSEISFALYARDALALAYLTADGLPALTPPVDVQPRPGGDKAVLAARWDVWWNDLMGSAGPHGQSGPPADLHSPPGGQWLTEAAPGLRNDYSRWNARRRQAQADSGAPESRSLLPVGDVVNEVTRQLGREPQFSLSMTEIPVQGAVWRRIAPDHVLVSRQQLEHSETSAKLAEIVRDLDGGGPATGGL
jgi:hypothetical protein